MKNFFMFSAIFQDHALHPRHRKDEIVMQCKGHAANPMCADVIDVGLEIVDGVIVDVSFAGKGCAVCVGGASLLCEFARGKNVALLCEEIEQNSSVHLGDMPIGRMREGCVTVSVMAMRRAFLLSRQ